MVRHLHKYNPEPGLNAVRCWGEWDEEVGIMGRTAVVVGIWFAIWMIAGGAIAGLASTSPDISPHVFYGVMNGAFFAVLTSFSWPWIMPRLIDRWMTQGERGEA